MSRREKTLILTSDNLRKPCVVKPSLVHTHLMKYRQKQKFYYDQHAKSRPPCEPGDSIRIPTPEGWKQAEYILSSEHQRSHIVKAGSHGRTYRRNNCTLMKTREDPHSIQMKREVYIPSHSTQMKQETVIPQIPKLSVMNKPSTDPSPSENHKVTPQNQSTVTRIFINFCLGCSAKDRAREAEIPIWLHQYVIRWSAVKSMYCEQVIVIPVLSCVHFVFVQFVM